MSGPDRDEDLDDQVERTLLSWRRTALSLLATGLLVAHLAAQRAGGEGLLLTLAATGAVVAFVWLGRGLPTSVNGLALAVGVLLLGAVALVSVTAR